MGWHISRKDFLKLYSSLISKDNKPEFGVDRRDKWQDHVTREISKHSYKDNKNHANKTKPFSKDEI